MAEELNRELGISSDLIRSGGGVFEIEYGDDLVFSKRKSGRFPDQGEVVNLIKKTL